MKKKIRVIEILIVIGLTIFLSLNIICMSYKNKVLENSNNANKNSEIETLPDYIVTPGKSYAFLAEYSGEVSKIDAYKAFYELAYNTIPTYYKEFKNNNYQSIEEYFNLKKDDISKNLGINNKKDFSNFISKITKFESEELIFETYEFDRETIKINKGETSANLIIIYKDNKKITINITLQLI